MNGFDVDTDRITTAATGVEAIAEALQGEIATMESIMAELSTGWQSSSAAPRFAAAMEGYLADAGILAQALTSHGDGLSRASTSFAQADDAIAEATPGAAGAGTAATMAVA